ncbi:putative two-component system response regulator [Desulfosalsimonas propionicica]|uniref:Putative two-component system response regulator n=1 Tax=Desulfosalsimonas propionicica TaxID=332175 RepID=A0A7W0C659_9BACT|nr:HD domain-containing phosphohydrolase [Desulfosalsimonas propionicica]MBA2879866.1 putative two-component system response regulator [Desulfosalsimonas propionicica]
MNLQNVKIPSEIPVLVVDDETPITEMLFQALSKAGYTCRTAANGEQALSVMAENHFDVVLTDIRMPGMNGVDLLKKIKAAYDSDVMVMTGFTEDYNYESIVTAGASDFIQKPISFKELTIRLKRVLRMRYLLVERDQINTELQNSVKKLKKYSVELKNALIEVEDAHEELQYAYLDTINRLVSAAEYKDEETGDHIVRMSGYCTLMAEKIGLTDETVKLIQYASPMHDIGKIGIPDQILLKPGRLTADEFETIKTHTTIGASILAESRADVLKTAHEIALNHHEKWDGSGYPRGLKKEEIPISGRIVGIADIFDALTSRRPYKDPYPLEVAVEIIRSEQGVKLDPDLVAVFISHIDQVEQIRREVGEVENASLADFAWSERDQAVHMDRIIAPRLK